MVKNRQKSQLSVRVYNNRPIITKNCEKYARKIVKISVDMGLISEKICMGGWVFPFPVRTPPSLLWSSPPPRGWNGIWWNCHEWNCPGWNCPGLNCLGGNCTEWNCPGWNCPGWNCPGWKIQPPHLFQTPRLFISRKCADPPVYSRPPLYSGLKSICLLHAMLWNFSIGWYFSSIALKPPNNRSYT